MTAGELKLDRAGLDKIFLNLADNSIRTGVFTLEGATLSTALDKEGRARLFDAMGAPAKKNTEASGQTQSDPAPWNIAMEGASLKGLDLDRGQGRPDSDQGSSLQVGPVRWTQKRNPCKSAPWN
jgi:hypothetical protein